MYLRGIETVFFGEIMDTALVPNVPKRNRDCSTKSNSLGSIVVPNVPKRNRDSATRILSIGSEGA